MIEKMKCYTIYPGSSDQPNTHNKELTTLLTTIIKKQSDEAECIISVVMFQAAINHFFARKRATDAGWVATTTTGTKRSCAHGVS